MNIKEFENNRWFHEDQKLCFRHKATLEMMSKINDVSGMTVLDLGCGDGLLLSILKEKGISGKGLDISEEGIAKARKKGLDVSIFDFKDKLSTTSNSFNVVISLDVLEHLYDPESLMKEMERVSMCTVIIGVPNFNSIPARLQVLFGKVPENNVPHKGHVYWFNQDVLMNMASRNGLKIKEMRVNTVMEDQFLIGKIFKWLAKMFPAMFALSFVVCFEKASNF